MSERRTKELSFAAFSQATADTHIVVPAVVGQFFRVHRVLLMAAATQTIQFTRTASVLTGVMTLATGIPFIMPYSVEPWFTGADNQAFNIVLGNAVQTSGMIEYIRSS